MVDIYGIKFCITDADAFTRAFYCKLGVALGGKIVPPADPYATDRAEVSARTMRNLDKKDPVADTLKSSGSLALSRGERHCKYDRKVLKFFMAWDDTAPIQPMVPTKVARQNSFDEDGAVKMPAAVEEVQNSLRVLRRGILPDGR